MIGWLRHTFTLRRWNRNPFQLWMLFLLNQVSFNQIFFADVSGAVSDLDRRAQLLLSICNLVGGSFVMIGLNLREKTMAQWIELCGYIALTGSMGMYVWLVLKLSTPPNTSFGLGLSEAFVLASLHRAYLIAIRKFKAEIIAPRKEVPRGSGTDDDDQGEVDVRGAGR